MYQVPTKPLPNQTFEVVLYGQNCSISLRQLNDNLYFSLTVNDVVHATNVICRNAAPLVQAKYLGFLGNFLFVDFRGDLDPTYDGLGDRYFLVYLSESDLA